MSTLETAAKSVLIPLIRGEPSKITEASALVLAQWVALKIMVGEHNQRGDAVVTPQERVRFRATQQMPENLRIWLARCGVGGWKTAYRRQAGTVSLTPEIQIRSQIKNIHSITFGVGDLLVHVLHATVPDLKLDLSLSQPGIVLPLYPITGPMDWPPDRGVSAAEASYLAETLDRLFRDKNTRWMPFPE